MCLKCSCFLGEMMLHHYQMEQNINQSPHGATRCCEVTPWLFWCCCPKEMFWTPQDSTE